MRKQQGNKFFEDFSKIASSALGSVVSAGKDLEKNLKNFCSSYFEKLNLVKREEFEVLKLMVSKMRKDHEEILKRLNGKEGFKDFQESKTVDKKSTKPKVKK